jgi:hypothetical protein
MKPFVILVVLPVLIGIAAEMHYRDAKHASFAAAIGAALAVLLGVRLLDSEGTWSWLAAVLVSPLPIAFAVVTVLYFYGRSQMRGRRTKHGA